MVAPAVLSARRAAHLQAGRGLPGRQYLRGVRARHHQLYLKQANGSGGFFSIGGQTTADPALTAVSSTTLAVFCRGTNGAGFFTRYTTAGEAGWRSMGGQLTTGVSATSSPSTTYTYGLGTSVSVFGDTGTWTSYPPSFSGWKGF